MRRNSNARFLKSGKIWISCMHKVRFRMMSLIKRNIHKTFEDPRRIYEPLRGRNTFDQISIREHRKRDLKFEYTIMFVAETRENFNNTLRSTLKKILYLHPPKHELLNQFLIKTLNQPYYLVDSTKKFSQIIPFSRLN